MSFVYFFRGFTSFLAVPVWHVVLELTLVYVAGVIAQSTCADSITIVRNILFGCVFGYTRIVGCSVRNVEQTTTVCRKFTCGRPAVEVFSHKSAIVVDKLPAAVLETLVELALVGAAVDVCERTYAMAQAVLPLTWSIVLQGFRRALLYYMYLYIIICKHSRVLNISIWAQNMDSVAALTFVGRFDDAAGTVCMIEF